MDSAAIHDQVTRILQSNTFAAKHQLRKLLEILLENMECQSNLTPDRVIRELWPRETRTKRSTDVATEMNRLRHALDAYYAAEGANDPTVIYLPNRAAGGDNGSHETRWIAAKARERSKPAVIEPAPGPSAHSSSLLTAGIALAAIILVVGGAYIMARAKVPQPRFGRIDGSVLRIMDAGGKQLWTRSFPEGIGPAWYYDQAADGRIWFADLEGKGHTSVLFSYSPAAQPLQSSTLICYSDRGKEKWRWTPGRKLPELAGDPATSLTLAVGVLKATDKRPARIVVSSQLWPWWPNQIAILDANGKLVSEYWHSGTFFNMVLADLDGNGGQQIIATGVDNGYDHQATLVVLDPDRVTGASEEQNPQFQIHGMGAAQERLRLLFPRSDLNRALYQYNEATGPEFGQGHLRLTVTECIAPPGCDIWYEFDKNFSLIAAFAGGDEFRSAHNQFFQGGRGAHTLSPEEQAAFLKVRCLRGCKSEFVPVGELVP